MNLTDEQRNHLAALADRLEDEGDHVCELLRRIAKPGATYTFNRRAPHGWEYCRFIGGCMDGQVRMVQLGKESVEIETDAAELLRASAIAGWPDADVRSQNTKVVSLYSRHSVSTSQGQASVFLSVGDDGVIEHADVIAKLIAIACGM